MANRVLRAVEILAGWLPAPARKLLYRLGPLTRKIRSILNWAAPQELVEVQVSSGKLKGMRLLLDLQKEKSYWLGTYEPELQQAVSDWAKPKMVVYDLGANIGYFSLMVARDIEDGGKVYAFEALPTNLERLRANLALNPLRAPIEVLSKAVSDKSGSTTFLVHASNAMGKLIESSGRDTAYGQEIVVETISLDDFVFAQRHAPPDLVKIDIEGAEGLALMGMARLLREIRPFLFIELHGPDASESVWSQLKAADYALHQLTTGYPPIPSLEAPQWKNYILGRPPT